jgi:hypothetical protein
LHFTLKGTDFEKIKKSITETLQLLKKELLLGNDDILLHHCFLSREELIERGWSLEVDDWFNSLKYNVKCWMKDKTIQDCTEQRKKMFDYLSDDKNAISIFIQPIVQGVDEELKLATKVINRVLIK